MTKRLIEGFTVLKYGNFDMNSKLRTYRYIQNEEKIYWNTDKIMNGNNCFYIYDIIELEKIETHEIKIKYKRNFYNEFGKVIRKNRWIFKNQTERDEIYDLIQSEYERISAQAFLCMERRLRDRLISQESNSYST